MSDVINYPLSAAIELCEQLDNDLTNYHLKMLEYKRERDEARKELEEYRSIAENIGAERAVSEKEKAIRERDEAREHLREISEYGTEEINAAVELRQKLAQVLVERDEAREELHDIRLNLGADAEGYILLHAVCVLQQERDDERAVREAYKQLAVKHALERDEARKEVRLLQAILDIIRKDSL